MRYEELLDVLKDLNIQVVPTEGTSVRGYTFEAYKKLAMQTENVDYDCQFRNGTCQGPDLGREDGCCSMCGKTFGYWCKEAGALDEATVKTMAEFFEQRTGFFRDGTGCILPRELRSPTCLYIFCSDARMSGADRELLFRIQFGASWSGSKPA